MGLPIVTGGRSSLSRRLLPPALKDIVSCSCSYCGCNNSGHPHKVAFCRSECSTLTATLTVTYFQGREEEITARMKETEDFEFIYDNITNIHDRGSTTRFAGVEICISDFSSSSCHGYTARRRISKYCIPLEELSNPSFIDERTIGITPRVFTPKVLFSSYDRYLACLIPHGCCTGSYSGSSLVIFRLDSSTPDDKIHLPLPSFLPQDAPKQNNNSLKIAVDPRIVPFRQQHPRFNITCICGATEPYFLAGCQTNGSIFAITWKRAKISGIIFDGFEDYTTENVNGGIIIRMSYIAFNSLTPNQQQGRLAVTYADGTINIFLSLINPTSQQCLKDRVAKLQLLCTLGNNSTTFYPILDSKWINYCTLAVAVDTVSEQKQDSTIVVCHVWEINSDTQNVISTLSLRTTDIKNTAGRSDETAVVDQRKDHSNSKNEEEDSWFSMQTRYHGRNSIIDIDCTCHHDSTIVISSVYYCQHEGVQSFFCLWDWKSCTLGFLLGQKQPLEFSRAFICKSGFLLYHIYVESNNKNTLVLDHFDLSVLNPPETRSARQSSQQQVSSLLLSSRYVNFPLCSHATLSCQANVSPDTTVDCRETRIPISYVSVHGVVRIATIGRKFCRSIAIASRRGLCILDLSHMYHLSANSNITNNVEQTVIGCHKQILPCVGTMTTALAQTDTVCCSHNVANKITKKLRQIKWRMFNEQDERQFKVHAMTWWERNSGQMKQQQQHGIKNVREPDYAPFEGNNYISPQSEDILFAVIEMMVDVSSASTLRTNDSRNEKKELHLVCWSRKRLGLNTADQLLMDVNKNMSNKGITQGILLPACIVNPSAISILTLPQNSPVSNNQGDKERALLLISSLNTPYFFVVVELQVYYETIIPLHDSTNASGSVHDFNRFGATFKILGRLYEGRVKIPDSVHADESIATSALTGVFLAGGSYDFDLEGVNADCNDRDPSSPFVTLGVITNSGSLFAVTFTGNLELSVAGPVIVQASPQSGVAFYWQSDTLICDYSFNTGCFLWTLCLRDGRMLMWSVPFFTRRDFISLYDTAVIDNFGIFLSLSSKIFATLDQPSHNKSSKSSLPLPIIVRPVGDQQFRTPAYDRVLGEVYTLASTTLRNNWAIPGDKYFVGLFPGSLTFVLSVGQRSRRFSCLRMPSWSCDYKINSLFCLTNCVLEPPSYTILLLSLVSQMVALKYLDSKGYRGHIDLARKLRRTVMEVAKARAFDQSLDAALRIIILSTLDMLQLIGDEEIVGMVNKSLLTSLLLEAVTIARDSLTPVHFSFFFLSLARQLEPRNYSLLFPLRFLVDTSSSDTVPRFEHEHIFSRSVEHLFMESVKAGTISIAASGLPMLKSQNASHRICVKMLHYCLEVIAEDCSSTDVEYHRLEEHTILRELFQYGLKVEDSLKFCQKLKCIHTSGDSFNEPVDSEDVTSSSAKSGFFSTVTSRIFSIIPPAERVLDNDNEIDKEILDSAHSFVYYAPQKSSNRILSTDDLSDEVVAVKNPMHEESSTETVKVTVVIFFVSSIFSRDGFAPSSTCWKALGFISQILTNVPQPTEYTTEFCQKVSRALLNNFVIADILCETTEKLLHRHAVIMDDNSSLTTFLLSHILECSRQIGKCSCADLFHFSMVLLQDLSESHATFTVLSTELAIILLITGYLAGAHDFISEVLLATDSKFSMAFNKAVGAYNSIL